MNYTVKERGFQRKILAFSGDANLEMEKVCSKGIPRKFWGWIEAEQEIIHSEEEEVTITRIGRKTPILTPAPQSNQSYLYSLHRSRYRGEGEPNLHVVSIKRTADKTTQRSRKVIDNKKRKLKAKNKSLRNPSRDKKIILL